MTITLRCQSDIYSRTVTNTVTNWSQFFTNAICLYSALILCTQQRRTIRLLNRQGKTIAFQCVPSHVGIHRNETADLLAKKGTTLQNKQTSPNFETVKRLIKKKTQEKFCQEANASSSKTQWQNKSTWESNKNKPRKQAVANFRLNTGHDCLTAHLHRIKILSHNYCKICKLKNTKMDKDHLLRAPKTRP